MAQPTAAPYFASYLLLQVAIQPCFEVFRFGVSLRNWLRERCVLICSSLRLSIGSAPYTQLYRANVIRGRNSESSTRSDKLVDLRRSPTFSHFSQVPYQRECLLEHF